MVTLRFLLTFAVIFLAPGYTFSLLLFPAGGKIDRVERFLIAISTSTAFSSLAAFGLLALRLSLNPLNFILTISVLSILFLCAGLGRVGFGKRLNLSLPVAWEWIKRSVSPAWAGIALTALAALIAANALIPWRPAGMTEFYISPEWLDGGSGHLRIATEVSSVPVEINNLENKPAHYRIEAVVDDVLIWESGDILVAEGASAGCEIPIQPNSAGLGQRFIFNLYKDSSQTITAALTLSVPAIQK